MTDNPGCFWGEFEDGKQVAECSNEAAQFRLYYRDSDGYSIDDYYCAAHCPDLATWRAEVESEIGTHEIEVNEWREGEWWTI